MKLSTAGTGSLWLWRMAAALVVLLGLCTQAVAAPSAPPAEVRARMKPGGISLRYETRRIGPDNSDIMLHIYVVPKGRDPQAVMNDTVPASGPIKREHIVSGPSLQPSPFYLDIFARRGGRLQLLNSVPFTETKDVAEIATRWLYPRQKRGPVVALHFGYSHWHEWQLIVFPESFSGKPVVQEFLFGGEGESYLVQKLDQVDARGRMVIHEEEGYEGGRVKRRVYRWDGKEFTNPVARYFLIAASTKTRAEAERFAKRPNILSATIRHSDEYPRLRKGYCIVLLGRYETTQEASEVAKWYRQQNVPTYIRRAF